MKAAPAADGTRVGAARANGTAPRLHPLHRLSDGGPLGALADALPALPFALSLDGADLYLGHGWLDHTGAADFDALAAAWHADEGLIGALGALEDDTLERRFTLNDVHGRPSALLARVRLARDAGGEPLLWTGVADVEPSHSALDESFLALVSHALRSPLNAIRGWAHVLRRTGALTPAQQRALDAIDRSVASGAGLIHDLIDTRRAHTGTAAPGLEPQPEPAATSSDAVPAGLEWPAPSLDRVANGRAGPAP